MAKRFNRLMNRTGAEGTMSILDQEIRRVMAQEKDIAGDTVGSSSSGIVVKGIKLMLHPKQINNFQF